MAVNVEEFNRLKTRADRARSETERAKGALDEQMRKLKAEFSVDTLEEAEALLRSLEIKEEETEEAYRAALKDFQEKWGEKI